MKLTDKQEIHLMKNVETLKIVRKVLEIHRIQRNCGMNDSNSSWVPRKCVGCAWIGWDHEQHVAEEIVGSLESS